MNGVLRFLSVKPEYINERIRTRIQALKRKGWKQSAIAQGMGVSAPWMSKFLHGEGVVDTVQLVRLADFLEISVLDLIGLESPARKETRRSEANELPSVATGTAGGRFHPTDP